MLRVPVGAKKKAADEPRPEVVREETPKNWAAAPKRYKNNIAK